MNGMWAAGQWDSGLPELSTDQGKECELGLVGPVGPLGRRVAGLGELTRPSAEWLPDQEAGLQ